MHEDVFDEKEKDSKGWKPFHLNRINLRFRQRGCRHLISVGVELIRTHRRWG